MLTIAIVEDNLLHADYISTYVARLPNCSVVTIAHNGFAFLQYCANNPPPDMAIMDVAMPVMDGVSCVDYLTQYHSSIAIIALSNYAERESVEDMLACGAKGYVVKLLPNLRAFTAIKDNTYFNLRTAIAEVAAGNYYIDTHILTASENLNYTFNPTELVAKRKAELAKLSSIKLTERERKVAALYAAVNTPQKDISTMLDIHNKTFDKHVQAASKKLGAKSRHWLSIRILGIGLIKVARGVFLNNTKTAS